MKTKVIHQLSLVGIGGVQQSFVPYLKLSLKKSKFQHSVYGMHKLDIFYNDIKSNYFNIKESLLIKVKFLFCLYSKKYIIHFYNNIGSQQVSKILDYCPSSNIIFHERGTAWNATNNDEIFYQKNISKAVLVLANSNASKIMLMQKFNIPEEKIKVIYNGFLNRDYKYILPFSIEKRYSEKFSVGYIGRLDTPKGVHILIEAAKLLSQFDFFIAGDGALKNDLMKLAKKFSNIHFIGRIKNPLEFIYKIDLLVVPSIREPLGNTIIEAGFCQKAVIASNVDGIPEIIENEISGILLNPKNELSFKSLTRGAVPFPSYVVNPDSKQLVKPKEIDPLELSYTIEELALNQNKRLSLGQALEKKVRKNFTIESYFEQIEKVYKEVINN